MSIIWSRAPKPRPYIVWEGTRGGAATGQAYRRRWRAIVAAWVLSRYAYQDVWIEHELPTIGGGS